jgi:hypothetical protein
MTRWTLFFFYVKRGSKEEEYYANIPDTDIDIYRTCNRAVTFINVVYLSGYRDSHYGIKEREDIRRFLRGFGSLFCGADDPWYKVDGKDIPDIDKWNGILEKYLVNYEDPLPDGHQTIKSLHLYDDRNI